MTDANAQPPVPEVRIDRLVLDIPGLDAAQGRALALGIAEGLADAGVKTGAMMGAMTAAQGERAMISVRLAATAGTPADMAAQIVAALLERLA
jgi:hypothetical protein